LFLQLLLTICSEFVYKAAMTLEARSRSRRCDDMTRRRTRILAADIGGGHAVGAAAMLVRRRADCPLDAEPSSGDYAYSAWHQGGSAMTAPAGPGHCQPLYQLAARFLRRSQRRLGALLSCVGFGWYEGRAMGRRKGEGVRGRVGEAMLMGGCSRVVVGKYAGRWR
jgi:hypothetical protein